MKRVRDHGFTLVELLVALFIFALIAAAGVALIGGSVRLQAASARQMARMEDVGRVAALVASDLAQAADRPVRDAPAFVLDGRPNAPALIAWTRAGPPAGTERIALALESGALVRRGVAPAEGSAVSREVLLTGVDAVGLRAKTKGEWRIVRDASSAGGWPDAVELTLIGAARPPLRLIFVVGVPRP